MKFILFTMLVKRELSLVLKTALILSKSLRSMNGIQRIHLMKKSFLVARVTSLKL
jgi:hypothetical protein